MSYAPTHPMQAVQPAARPPLAPPVHDLASVFAMICAFGFAPLGIILGHAALRDAKRHDRQPSGLATGGMVLGYIFTAIAVLVMIAFGAALAHTGA